MTRLKLFVLFVLVILALLITLPVFAQEGEATDISAETAEPTSLLEATALETELPVATETPPPFVTPTDIVATPTESDYITPTDSATATEAATDVPPPVDPPDPPIIINQPPPAPSDGSINFAYIFGSVALIVALYQAWRSSGKVDPKQVQEIIDRERAHALTTKTPVDNVAIDLIEAIAGVLLRLQAAQPPAPVPAPVAAPSGLNWLAQARVSGFDLNELPDGSYKMVRTPVPLAETSTPPEAGG